MYNNLKLGQKVAVEKEAGLIPVANRTEYELIITMSNYANDKILQGHSGFGLDFDNPIEIDGEEIGYWGLVYAKKV